MEGTLAGAGDNWEGRGMMAVTAVTAALTAALMAAALMAGSLAGAEVEAAEGVSREPAVVVKVAEEGADRIRQRSYHLQTDQPTPCNC